MDNLVEPHTKQNSVYETASKDDTLKNIVTELPRQSLEEHDSKLKINTRALPKDAATYELEKFEKKSLIIFNQKIFIEHTSRYGTEKDVDALKSTFETLGFEVKVHTDLTKKEILVELNRFSRTNFTDYGCVGVAVLTHGSRQGLLHAKDESFNELDVIDSFKVHEKPTLVSKPRFFIIQACRGEIAPPGAPVTYAGTTDEKFDASLEPYILPAEADMLILHSSFVGRVSYRNPNEGSWFILALCDKIDKLAATHDIESIMTEVKREVAFEKEAINKDEYGEVPFITKQMPVMTSTLIRKLYFKKFKDPSPMIRTADRHQCHGCFSRGDKHGSDEQSGPCSCALGYFGYLENCVRLYLEENPTDKVARAYLNIAKSYGDTEEFNEPKKVMIKTMCEHLSEEASRWQYYKYFFVV